MSVYRKIGRSLILVATFLATGAAAEDINGLHPSAVEVASLPKFCWHQFLGKRFDGPVFKIPKSCGVGMNHYCPGLVQLNRANRSFDKLDHRRWLLKSAKGSFEYTIKAMRNYHCPLRGEVNNMLRLVNGLLGGAK